MQPVHPPYRPTPQSAADNAGRNSVAMLAIGACAAVAGIYGLVHVARAYALCSSPLGALAQAGHYATVVACDQDQLVHYGSLVAIGAGALLAVAGVIRLSIAPR
jgi:hypothetical protein